MHKPTKEQFQIAAWALAGITVLLALFVWLDGLRWNLDRLTAYQLFPLLGLLAFGLMWTHYVVAAFRQVFGYEKTVTKQFFSLTSWTVLGLIVLHPSILIITLWRDGFGLPPGSYLNNYVAPSLKWAAALGTFSLFIFLAYELHRLFETRKWWVYVQAASDLAILAIFIHGLKLGMHTQSGWFRAVWIFYGISLVLCLIYMYVRKVREHGLRFRED